MTGFRYTDDPIADVAAYDAEMARLAEQVPICSEHPGPIMEDFYYEIDEGRPLCAECLDTHHKRKVVGWLECDYCGEAIDDEYCYANDDDEVFCKACVDRHFRKEVVVE